MLCLGYDLTVKCTISRGSACWAHELS